MFEFITKNSLENAFLNKNNKMILIKVVHTGKAKTLNITSKKMIFGNMHNFSEKLTILKKKINFTNYAHNLF